MLLLSASAQSSLNTPSCRFLFSWMNLWCVLNTCRGKRHWRKSDIVTYCEVKSSMLSCVCATSCENSSRFCCEVWAGDPNKIEVHEGIFSLCEFFSRQSSGFLIKLIILVYVLSQLYQNLRKETQRQKNKKSMMIIALQPCELFQSDGPERLQLQNALRKHIFRSSFVHVRDLLLLKYFTVLKVVWINQLKIIIH